MPILDYAVLDGSAQSERMVRAVILFRWGVPALTVCHATGITPDEAHLLQWRTTAGQTGYLDDRISPSFAANPHRVVAAALALAVSVGSLDAACKLAGVGPGELADYVTRAIDLDAAVGRRERVVRSIDESFRAAGFGDLDAPDSNAAGDAASDGGDRG